MIRKTAPCSVIVGVRGAGKSSNNEALGTHFVHVDKPPEKTGKIVDFFGSRDNEGLAWLRSPYSESVLAIGGDSVDVSGPFDYKRISDVHVSDFRKYKVMVSVAHFYNGIREEHHAIQALMDKLWKRTHWNYPWYLMIREAASLIYSRISIGEDQKSAKSYFIYVLREARHLGYAVGADAIRMRAIDIDLRSVADFMFLKNPGIHGIKEVSFVYGYFDPLRTMWMPPERFILLTRHGTIAAGEFEFPWWHKTEKEDLVKEFDIQVDKGEPINYGKGRRSVNDFEHIKMVRLKHEKKDGNIPTYAFVGAKVQREAMTVLKHIRDHNENVKTLGYCQRCKRARGEFEKEEIET